ncbi:MAG TPA: YwqG family protein [Gemmataceae bacterium]|nr:YwqG family protein [Gemmataceae bacterium]
MIDKRVVDVIHALGHETDTPQEIVADIVRRALPSIRLVAQFPKKGKRSRLGGCRIGGLPDLPIGVEWPRRSRAKKEYPSERQSADEPLWFLMQINLAEVAFADLAKVLPKVGILYFFYHWHNAADDDPAAWLVLFHKDAEQGLRQVKAPADLHSTGHFRGFNLLPRLEWMVPDCDNTNYHLGIWDNLKEPVAEVQGLEASWGPTPIYRMLGYPEFLQADGLGEGDILLLQVSSDCQAGITEVGPYPETGMRWGDHGRIYYIINEADLKARYFGNLWAQLEDQ